jgi:tetratricopeptide (TPR) repeat protein
VKDPRSHPAVYPLACVLAAMTVVGTYANHFHGEFHFDDFHTISNNLYIRDLRNLPLFFTSPKTFSSLPSNQSYRPLVTTTLAIDYRLGGGLNPVAFHATNFVLFLIQCAVMLVLYRRIMDHARPHASNRWIALLATTWYALHPANAETVNYIIARSELLSTLGVSLAIAMFAAGGRARHYGLYLIPAAAAVLGKEQGAMVAPLLFLYVAFFERDQSLGELLQPREIAATLRSTWPTFLVCGAVVAGSLRLATTFNLGGASRWYYMLAQPFVLVHYVLTFFLPLSLSADTAWQPIANPFDDRVVVGVALIGCSLALAFVSSRRRETRPVTFGVLWFFVALLPTSSIVALSEVLNDHRMYFPFVGLTLAVFWGVALAFERRAHLFAAGPLTRALPAGAMVAALFAIAYGTRQRNEVWRTEESLWLDVTRKSPENGRGLMTYGVIQMSKGRYSIAQQYFERALQYTPRYAYLYVNLGVLKGALGQGAEAERYFRAAQQYDPSNPVSYVFYARWLASAGRGEEAITQVRRAVELSSADLEARTLLQELQAHAMASAADTPEQWLAISLTQYRAGQYQACIESSQQALRRRPHYAEAFNNICAANNALGRYAEAAAACERAIALKPDLELARNNLALTKSRLGQ